MARLLQSNFRNILAMQFRMSSDKPGKGAGKGGPSGKSGREAVFGSKQGAKEELYFKRKQEEQLAALKVHHQDEIDHYMKEIERLQKEIGRHKKKIGQLKGD